MDTKTKFREAFKIGISFAIVYGIALKMNWLNPYWAGWAVVMIALPTTGQTMQKGLLRIAGTIPGAIGALIILSIAPQQRWLFLLLLSVWTFFTTYMMLTDKKHSYAWFVMGYVAMIVMLTGPSSSYDLFMAATFRVVENIMGMTVYILVAIFIWPVTSSGAIKKASENLMATQAKIFSIGYNKIITKDEKKYLEKLHTNEIQQLDLLTQAIGAEAVESYDAQEVKHLWERFNLITISIIKILDRWQTGYDEFVQIDINNVLPNYQIFHKEINERFEEIQRLLSGKNAIKEPIGISLTVDKSSFHRLSHLDRAAIMMEKQVFERIGVLTSEALECVLEINRYSKSTKKHAPQHSFSKKHKSSKLPVIDIDNLRGAIYSTSAIVLMFIIWIYFDPPGHIINITLAGTIAMLFLTVQHSFRKDLGKYVTIASLIALAAYVFIMPHLSSFLGLGLLLFGGMFLVSFFFSGAARLGGQVAILNEIAVSNPQVYNFAAMANFTLGVILVLVVLFLLAYIINSPRPEKAVVKMTGRFFRSTEFLISSIWSNPGHHLSLLERWKKDFYRHEMQTLPNKIEAIGMTINPKYFPENSPQQVRFLTIDLQALAYRFIEMFDADVDQDEKLLGLKLKKNFREWQGMIVKIHREWSKNPEVELNDRLKNELIMKLKNITDNFDKLFEKDYENLLTETNGEIFYRLLGGLRGVTQATISYAGITGILNWEKWREEVFQ